MMTERMTPTMWKMTTATTRTKVTTMTMDPRGLPGGLTDGVGARWLGVVGRGGYTPERSS